MYSIGIAGIAIDFYLIEFAKKFWEHKRNFVGISPGGESDLARSTRTSPHMADDYVVGAPRIQKETKLTGSQWLQTTPVGTLFPDKRKILSVSATDSVPTAFKILTENKILSVPVWDDHHRRYVGFIDMLDVVYTIVDACKEVELTGGSLSQVLEKSQQLKRLTCGQVADISGRNPFYPVQDTAPILAAMELMVDHRVHRIPIVNAEGDLVSIVTQSHLVRLLAEKIDMFPAFARLRVAELKLGYKEVLSVKEVN